MRVPPNPILRTHVETTLLNACRHALEHLQELADRNREVIASLQHAIDGAEARNKGKAKEE